MLVDLLLCCVGFLTCRDFPDTHNLYKTTGLKKHSHVFRHLEMMHVISFIIRVFIVSAILNRCKDPGNKDVMSKVEIIFFVVTKLNCC